MHFKAVDLDENGSIRFPSNNPLKVIWVIQLRQKDVKIYGDTSLLDSDLFRRDQVWFVQKDDKQGSRLYSLLDFKPRKEEAIGKGYLQGRYGALPYIGKFRS